MPALQRSLPRWLAMCAGALAGCASNPTSDLSDLAEQPPLPYKVLVSGGAFVRPEADDAAPLQRTFRPAVETEEAIPLQEIVDILRRGNVYVDTTPHADLQAARLRVAQTSGPTPRADTAMQQFLRAARESGHDLILVVEQLDDGPVQARGVNGQWPITLAVWLMIGLGMVIPDHTYESDARLLFELREVQSGRTLYEGVSDGGAVDLSLIERTDWVGILQSAIVPPFWVSDAPQEVERRVRTTVAARLLVDMARDLKSFDTQSRVQYNLPALITAQRREDGLTIAVDAVESVAAANVRLDGTTLASAEGLAFERELLASVEARGPRFLYRALLPSAVLEGARQLQLQVQTVTGRTASTTVLTSGVAAGAGR